MAADAIDTLKKLKVALKGAGRVALEKGIWPEGKRQQAFLAALFDRSLVVDEAGHAFKVMSASRRHYLWKVRNMLDPRPLHMTNTLAAALGAPQAFLKTQYGFSISPPRANFLAVVPGRAGGPGTGRRARRERRQFLNTYFRHANVRALGRIGKLGAIQKAKVKAKGMDAIRALLKRMLGPAMMIKGGIATINLELGKLGLERV